MDTPSLSVSLNNKPIGKLTATRKGSRFSFSDNLVETYAGQPLLSTSLLVKTRSYSEGLTSAWFEGLVPEGSRLDRICRDIGCSTSDYFSVLKQYGWECAGAVSLTPDGSTPPNHEQDLSSSKNNVTRLTEKDLCRFLSDLPEYEAQMTQPARLSLGGFQEKACLCASNLKTRKGYVSKADFFIPDPKTISTYILKPQPTSRFPYLIEGEAWALHTASFAARCSEAVLLQLDNAPTTLVVKRFDRAESPNGIVRVHQEDCCQALGLPPSEKYASHTQEKGSDPRYADIAGLLMRYSAEPEKERIELLKQLCVNLAMGNTDAHAKNYAFLYKQLCLPELSPMYDLVPVVDIEPEASVLSIRINHKIRLDDIRFEDIVLEASSWGIADDEAYETVRETMKDLREGAHSASLLYPEAGKRHAEALDSRISRILEE